MRIHRRLKTIICAVALTASAILTPLHTFAAVDVASGSLSAAFAPKNVMVNVKNADVRDVLSAIATNMGYNIVYTGPATTVSINLDNLSPSAAFDYVLKTLDLTYLQEGSTYIVGDRATLQDNFSSSLALTRFNLRYINPTVMQDMISQLRLPVTVITLNTNANSLWIQGFPSDIAKVRELVNVMDIVDNSEDPVAEESINGKSLTPIQLSYLTSYEFRLLLQSLGIDYSVSLLDDSNRIYLYATPEELDTVLGIKDVVDQKNTYLDEGGDGFAVLTAYDMVAKDTAISAIGAVCTGLSVVSADNRSTAFVLIGDPTEISKAKELMRKLNSNAEDLYTTYFTYKLKHITAAEAERRLKGVTFGDNVVWYVTTHADFSGTIFVYCTIDYQDQIRDLIADLDSEKGTLATGAGITGIPIYAARNADPTTRESYADGMLEYLEIMLGDILTNKITKKEFDNMTVLYLSTSDITVTAETLSLIEAMIARLNAVAVDEQTIDVENITFAYWWKNVKGGTGDSNPVPDSSAIIPADLQAYAAWLVGQIGIGSASAPFAIAPFGFSEQYSSEPTIPAYDTPQPDDTPTPVSAEETAFNEAKAALDWLFYEGGIVSDLTSQTTVESVVQAATRETKGISGVVLRLNPSAPPSYVQPTKSDEGSLTASIILEVGGYWEVYDIELGLPKDKNAEE